MLKRMQNSLMEYDNRYELGGNYFELIEFSLQRKLADGRELVGVYGINVVKVREVVHMPKINPLATRVPGISGIFELRGIPIPAVNLCTVLGDPDSPVTPDQQIIVTEFSNKRAGFIVHATNRIRRVAWDRVLPPAADSTAAMTGMMLIDNNDFLFILDLEKIVMQLEGRTNTHGFSPPGGDSGLGSPMPLPMGAGMPFQMQLGMHQAMAQMQMQQRQDAMNPQSLPCVLLVDDSNLILGNLARVLAGEGYRVLVARNGVEALAVMNHSLQPNSPVGTIHAILTDVEMPQMDGLSLIREIRKIPKLDKVPIYLHTSLSDPNSKQNGLRLGANGFFMKNDLQGILDALKTFFATKRIPA